MRRGAVACLAAVLLAAAPPPSGSPSAAAPSAAAPPPVSVPAPPPPSAAPAPTAAAPEAPGVTCTEHVPDPKSRPTMTEKIAPRAKSGYTLLLEIAVEHGKGEKVLPGGFRPELDSDAAKAIEHAGFALPSPEGVAATVQVEARGDRARSVVALPFVPLPPKPGRHELDLPPVPIAVARASGEIVTLCTSSHRVLVEDPIASTPDAKPKPNPPPRRQLEEWTLAKHVTVAAFVALVVGALLAWLIGRWLRRPKPAPPPPPPRPPWEVALEELFDVRHAGLIQQGRFAEHFDRVSYAVRRYLGDRYGFDGLESTTHEILTLLRRVTPPVPVLSDIEVFLREADLVKFAKVSPAEVGCGEALDRGEGIVRRTIPPALPRPEGPVALAAPAGGPG